MKSIPMKVVPLWILLVASLETFWRLRPLFLLASSTASEERIVKGHGSSPGHPLLRQQSLCLVSACPRP